MLLIGPLPPPITGISLANKVVYENFPKYFPYIKVQYIDTSIPIFENKITKFQKIKTSLFMYKNLYKLFYVDKVYITPGQTFAGVLRYAPFILLAKVFKKEIILHSHGNFLHQEYERSGKLKKIIMNFILSKADKGIVLSPSLKKNLGYFIPEERIFIVYNFVEDYLLESIPEKNFDEIRIIFLSNLMYEKGILDLLEALTLLKKKDINFKAKLAGNIEARIKEEIERYLKDLKGYVEYVGVVDKEDKKELLNWGNIFVFPTFYHREAQPISILEAMAMGNAVLTTRHGGIPDIFKEGINGFYIEKQNPKDIVDKIIYLYENKDLWRKISEQNIKETREKYTVEKFIKSLKEVFEAKV